MDFLLLGVDFVSDVAEGEGGGDGDVFDAVHVKVSSFFERVSDELWDVSFFEDGDDLLSVVLGLLVLLLVDALLVDFFSEFAHGLFAVFDFGEEGRGNHIHHQVLY